MRLSTLEVMSILVTLSVAVRVAGQVLASVSITKKWGLMKLLTCLGLLLVVGVSSALGQETTGGLQGTVKDPSGAVVPDAKVVVKASSLVGEKSLSHG